MIPGRRLPLGPFSPPAAAFGIRLWRSGAVLTGMAQVPTPVPTGARTVRPLGNLALSTASLARQCDAVKADYSRRAPGSYRDRRVGVRSPDFWWLIPHALEQIHNAYFERSRDQVQAAPASEA